MSPAAASGRAVRALLRLCLLSWPPRTRRTLGAELIDAAERSVREARRRGRTAAARELAGECAALLKEGARLRLPRPNAGGARRRGDPTGWALDLRLAVRRLLRSPGLTAVAATTLALGVGANAAMFDAVDRTLFRPPPFAEPERLVLVWNTLPGSSDRLAVAAPDVAVLRERARTLEAVAFTNRVTDGALETREEEQVRHVRVAAVTPDLFRVLGVEPLLGRAFVPEDGSGGGEPDGDSAGPPAVLLSADTWRGAFGADPGVVGREIRLNGRPATVVGVLGADHRLPLPPEAGIETRVDVWVPLRVPLGAFRRQDGRLVDRDSDNTGAVVARLAPGARLADARAEVARIAEELRAEVPAYAAAGLGADVRPLHEDATDHARPILLPLLFGVGLVLLVASLNLATLLLARSVRRRGEISLRVALGASRGRLVRQLLVERGLLVAVGAVAALGVAHLAAALLTRVMPPTLAPVPAGGLGGRALTVVVALSLAAGVVFALLPALRGAATSADPGRRPGRTRTSTAGGGARRTLVTLEVALTVVLALAAAGLLETGRRLGAEPPGFRAEGALTFSLSLRTPGRYGGPAERARLVEDVRRALRALPGVEAVGLVGVLPFSGERWTRPWGRPGEPPSAWEENRADFRSIGSGAFEALGTRLLEGRGFTPAEDLEERSRVVVVDEKLARRLAPPGTSAVGRTIGIPLDGAPVEARIVGVVEHVRYETLGRDGREAIYVPYRQEASRDVSFVVRAGADPAGLSDDVRAAIAAIDPGLPVYDVRTLDAAVAAAVAPQRFALAILAAFAGLALLCAGLGLYGMVALETGRRAREIGIRVALGASRPAVLAGVVREALSVAALGLGIGVLLALAAGRLSAAAGALGSPPPRAWALGIGAVALVTLAASAWPAWRASGVDAGSALRAE